MLGIAEGSHPETMDEKWFVPIQAHGVSVMSMAFLVDANSPMVWRGPMAAGALQQMLLQTSVGRVGLPVCGHASWHWRHSTDLVPKGASVWCGHCDDPAGL